MNVNTNKAIEFLLARGNLPILYWLKKDILDVPVEREHKNLQKFAARIRILESQKENGGWSRKKYEGNPRWENTYYIVETLHNAYRLHDYACSQDMEEIQRMVDFLFSTQTSEGDFRGAYFNEYAPTYHALTLEVLCLFGLDTDTRVQKGFRWLIRNRQDDGGWVIPYRTLEKAELRKRYTLDAQRRLKPIKPDTSKPFSHLVTGMVLRALAASATWRKNKDAKKAGELLTERFFSADIYEDRQSARFWEEINYPFWATDTLSSLDSLSRLGFTVEHPGIHKAFQWIAKRQDPHGYWKAGSKKATLEDHLWVTLSVLRVVKNLGLLEL
jgi:prenyltransferase beta subunit